ncbi:hypothetical protein PR002_g32657 [Phytophthora rubi]|uniref:Uncharacterized protein n=1 Tax=Phytophthora rubi TaxID=129364 RepID=A0A6A3G4I4_9STRA|nr:hypothetical protein PF003_g40950 [Phytophthora fragariae]KAE8952519.1 hypothetical protein PR002_g32657 [Phytophthora rubi]
MEGCGAFEAWISCKAWLVCRALLLFILGSVRSCKRRWFSGKISRCQRDAPGSIPGRRILFAASPFGLTHGPSTRSGALASLRRHQAGLRGHAVGCKSPARPTDRLWKPAVGRRDP